MISSDRTKDIAGEGMDARAQEFAILTAANSGEVLGARWEEIDLEARVWTVPTSRMKAGRVDRVPLPEGAIAVMRLVNLVSG